MNIKLSNQLVKDFPLLYDHILDEFIEFACGDGWFNLIYELSGKLQKLIEEEKLSDVFVLSIKAKYGYLRFYVSKETDKIKDLIFEAQKKSAETCEICGEPGCIEQEVWLSTKCELHKNHDINDKKLF